MTAVLVVENLTVRIGGLTAVDRMGLAVAAGSITSLIGPNGAGKTTAFNAITGYMTPQEGSVRFQECEVVGLPSELIAMRGLVRTFQRTSIFGGCSVFDNIMIALHRRGRGGALEALLRLGRLRGEERRLRAEAAEILHFVGLAERRDEQADNLAYGEQRLLGLAIALAAKPVLLLLDEPAAGLNPSETENFKSLIRRVRDDGVSILLVEHDMQMVMSISDRVFVLEQGRILTSGPPDVVQNDPAVIRAYLGTGFAHAQR